ncbi:enoyl-CoA hydratase/isomerase family protein [Ectobacillus sp. sgz5001026]|uniref:enoyl-CoA hydratase/isomerase family protein n=1 Tax=Ectobacillus sp. sgz5001026 TaxID=3242473 RepID=UPI0036D2CF6D
MKKVLVEQDEHDVVWATFNRPERRNAIDYDTMEELLEIIEAVEQSDARALVLTGTGKAFCSGGDLGVFHSLRTEEEAYAMLKKMGDILYKLMILSKPTIALLNGTAVGGGCEIATACDFRFASANAHVGFVQGTLAITTGWGGATMLYEKLPHHAAMQMLSSARRYSAEEAKNVGFLHEVISGEERKFCEKWISENLVMNESVLTAYKQAAVRKWNESNIKYRMEEEIKNCARLWESDHHHAAVQSFLSR